MTKITKEEVRKVAELARLELNKSEINNLQLERIIHGAKLKSYNFDIYKTNNKKNKNINLNIVSNQTTKINLLRKTSLFPDLTLH